MADMENKVEDSQEFDTNNDYEENSQGEENNQEAGDDEITLEQAMKWKEDLAKASKKIAEMKKLDKTNPKKTESSSDLELRLFFIENPEYKEDKEGILEILSQDKYKTLTPLEAKEIYKLNKPKQSESKQNDFSGGIYKPKPKGLGDLSEEEALKLSPQDYIKRLKLKGELR